MIPERNFFVFLQQALLLIQMEIKKVLCGSFEIKVEARICLHVNRKTSMVQNQRSFWETAAVLLNDPFFIGHCLAMSEATNTK